MARLRPLACLLAAQLLLGAAVPAQASPDATWYEVELLIFSRPGASIEVEQWPESILEKKEPGRDLLPAVPTGDEVLPFQQLPPEALRLTTASQRLSQARDVAPLLHLAWVQPGLPREQAVAVHLHGSEPVPELSGVEYGELDGTVRLILSRYLHLETDLGYRRLVSGEQPAAAVTEALAEFEPAGVPEAEATVPPPIEPATPGPDDVEPAEMAAPLTEGVDLFEAPAHYYRLVESRRMRSREVHYLDHPLFGVVAVITPWEPPAAPARPAAPAAPAAAPAVPPATPPSPATTPPAPAAPANGGLIRR